MALYVNGENVAESYSSLQPVSSGPGLVSVKVGENFDGLIDDLRIWNDIRTADEIADNMAALLDGGEQNLVAYYRFDDVNFDGRAEVAGTTSAAIDGDPSLAPKYYRYAADSRRGNAQDWKNSWGNAAILVGSATVTELTDATGNPFEFEVDSNYNDIPDRWEYKYFGQLLSDDASATGKYGDLDGDGISNYYEYLAGLDPRIKSTDGQIFDNVADSDGDGLTNAEEQVLGLNPGSSDSDDDYFHDGGEVFVRYERIGALPPFTYRR